MNSTQVSSLAAPFIACLFMMCGCTEQSMEKLTPVTQPPLTFSENNTTWTKEIEIPPAIETELAAIINHRPSLTDNPRMTGNPVLYSTSDGRIRFYWLTVGIEEMEWLYVEFSNGEFTTSDEGTGWEDTSG